MPSLRKVEYILQYDPKDIDIRLQHFTVGEMVNYIEKGKLEIFEENDLQRFTGLWDERRKSLLIESLMIRLPLPVFYLDGSEEPWRIVDGLQRLNTIYQFISKKSNESFKLKQLEYLKEEYHDFGFNNLPLFMQRRILEAPIEAFVINPGTPPEVKHNIFQRINTLGLRLNGQEIRNSVYRGTPAQFTKKLAEDPSFIRVTNKKVTVKRMLDREYATRFIAFQLFKDDYTSDIDEFLRYTMQYLYDASEGERSRIYKAFKRSMDMCFELLGSYAFYRLVPNGEPKGRIPNKALFDTLSWNLSKLENNEFENLMTNKRRFKREYITLLNENVNFFKAINDTTSSRIAVLNRFSILEEFIHKYI